MESEDLVSALADLKEKEALKIARARLNSDEDPTAILSDARRGMGIVGERFASGEYFIPDLVYSGEILKQITEMAKPKLSKEAAVKRLGKVVLGTVKGDLHDIGKNLVAMMLEGAGFEVVDLGTDVSPQQFVEAVKTEKPQLVGLSALLTTTMANMKTTVEAMIEAKIRDEVKILIGGAPVTEDFANEIGIDGYAPDAIRAVTVAKGLLG